jgi:hypothetical protein
LEEAMGSKENKKDVKERGKKGQNLEEVFESSVMDSLEPF